MPLLLVVLRILLAYTAFVSTWALSIPAKAQELSLVSVEAKISALLRNGSRHAVELADARHTHAQAEREPKHVVEHSAILKKRSLWMLMAVVNFCIGIFCMQMETTGRKDPAAVAPPNEGMHQTEPAEEPRSRTEVVRLVFCIVALQVSMLFWGVAQEFIMTNEYEDWNGHGEKLTNSVALVLFNRLASVAFCGFILKSTGTHIVFPGVYASAGPAASNLLASLCQYQSLAYVSFPLQTVAKSAKLMPVLVVSTMRGKRHTLLEYTEALLIVSALVVFGCETEGAEGSMRSTKVGILFLCGLLAADSVTPHLQDRLFKQHSDLSVAQATFAMSFFAAILSMFMLLCSGRLMSDLGFFVRHPDAALHAFVLSFCSTLSQFLISYTIKHFGPVVFVLIATTRQLLSVCLSAILFNHQISAVAWLAAAVLFATLMVRAAPRRTEDALAPQARALIEEGQGTFTRLVLELQARSRDSSLLVCAVGIVVPLGFYSVAQEFMATSSFEGETFDYPVFLVAMSRVGATLFAIVALKVQGIPVLNVKLAVCGAPAVVNILATMTQYAALYYIRYPLQSLTKSFKLIPVMLCGRLLKNRRYSLIDYAEAGVITVLVCAFTWSFDTGNYAGLGVGAESQHSSVVHGLCLMLCYVFADAFTSNIEDSIFQHERLDPAQMLLGMQAISGAIAFTTLVANGDLVSAVSFMARHPAALLHVVVLMLGEACGGYACMVSVKLFGPAVFTLLLMTHQILSLLVSVFLFNHNINRLTLLSMIMLTFVVFTSSIRRVACSAPDEIAKQSSAK